MGQQEAPFSSVCAQTWGPVVPDIGGQHLCPDAWSEQAWDGGQLSDRPLSPTGYSSRRVQSPSSKSNDTLSGISSIEPSKRSGSSHSLASVSSGQAGGRHLPRNRALRGAEGLEVRRTEGALLSWSKARVPCPIWLSALKWLRAQPWAGTTMASQVSGRGICPLAKGDSQAWHM